MDDYLLPEEVKKKLELLEPKTAKEKLEMAERILHEYYKTH